MERPQEEQAKKSGSCGTQGFGYSAPHGWRPCDGSSVLRWNNDGLVLSPKCTSCGSPAPWRRCRFCMRKLCNTCALCLHSICGSCRSRSRTQVQEFRAAEGERLYAMRYTRPENSTRPRNAANASPGRWYQGLDIMQPKRECKCRSLRDNRASVARG